LPALNTVELRAGSYGQMRKYVSCEQTGGNTLSWLYINKDSKCFIEAISILNSLEQELTL